MLVITPAVARYAGWVVQHLAAQYERMEWEEETE